MASLLLRPLRTWLVDLRQPPHQVERARALLSPAELQRADALCGERPARELILGHAALRRVLAADLGVEPRAVRLTEGLFGRPALADRRGLRFSLSHSGSLAVIALGGAYALGVDAERWPADAAGAIAVVERFCAPEEAAAVHRLEGPARPALARLWSRKEAYLKALGVGLRIPLSSFAVTVSGPPEVLRCAPGDPFGPGAWRLRELCLPGAVTGTVAAVGLPLPAVVQPQELSAQTRG